MKQRVLFIGTSFFSIQKEIMASLCKKGFDVDFFVMSRPRNILLDTVCRLSIKIEDGIQNKYYRKIWSSIESKKYHYIFIIKGDSIPDFFLKNIRSKNKNAKFILYIWDSIKNMARMPCSDCYDIIYTFDRKDSIQYGFQHKPSFYFRQLSENDPEKEYLVSLIGTLHSDRLFYAKYFSNLASEYSTPSFISLYAPVKSLVKFFLEGRVGHGWRLITTKKISLCSVDDITVKSNIILDFPHSDQSGLTLRFMSAIGMNKNIITTNTDVINYDFYDENYILVIDKHNLNHDKIKAFIDQSIGRSANFRNIENYYLSNWLNEFFK